MPAKHRDLERVAKWRRAQLIDAGFPPSIAGRVARDERYDLQALIELVADGCSPSLAATILEPIERATPHDPSPDAMPNRAKLRR